MRRGSMMVGRLRPARGEVPNSQWMHRMRLIGRLENEKLARRFGDYLTASQISNLVEPGSEGGWLIWIEDEEQLDPASEALARFQADPESPEFQRKREAARVRAINEREQEAYRKRQIDVRREWQRRASADAIPVTIAMILISIGVAVASAWGTDDRVLRPLRIADFLIDYDRVFYYPLIDLFSKC